MKKVKIAIVGASGLVGREVLKILAERELPISDIALIASEKSVGKTLPFRETELSIQSLPDFDFHGFDITIFCTPNSVSIEYVEKVAATGSVVIDNSSYYRPDPLVPIIIPEVNAEKITEYKNRNIICNANCAAMQMLVAVKPLHDYAKIKRIVISTYQSVSGIGKHAMDELYNHTRDYCNAKTLPPPSNFAKQIAFNAIPQIDRFMEDGCTVEEWKIEHDTHKILSPDIEVSATCVRVPVFKGHSEAVNIEFECPISPEKARELLVAANCVTVIDNPDELEYATPAEIAEKDCVFVSRIRQDKTVTNGLNMWIVADNIRKGAALNTVQITEDLVKLWTN